jgi:hypothetical protein
MAEDRNPASLREAAARLREAAAHADTPEAAAQLLAEAADLETMANLLEHRGPTSRASMT